MGERETTTRNSDASWPDAESKTSNWTYTSLHSNDRQYPTLETCWWLRDCRLTWKKYEQLKRCWGVKGGTEAGGYGKLPVKVLWSLVRWCRHFETTHTQRKHVGMDRREEAFKRLKYYSQEEELTLQCDASETAFGSSTLTPIERGYAQIEKECLAIVFGMEKFHQFHQYAYGKKLPPLASNFKAAWTLTFFNLKQTGLGSFYSGKIATHFCVKRCTSISGLCYYGWTNKEKVYHYRRWNF